MPFFQKVFSSKTALLLFIIIGAGLGYLYWQEIGCISGTCSITSSPINSTIYGALIGYLSFSSLKDLVVYLKRKTIAQSKI